VRVCSANNWPSEPHKIPGISWPAQRQLISKEDNHQVTNRSEFCDMVRYTSAPIFKAHYLLSSLKSSSGCARLLPRLSVPYMHPQITCFKNQFPRNMWPKSSLSSYILLYVGCSLPPWLHVTLLTLWHDRRNVFSQSFRSRSCLVKKVWNYLR